jgi:hypothetical protein
MSTHLVIGDPHCTPSANNERFIWAGRMAKDIKADKVICMGDFASMESMSSYDKKKKSFEGRRYRKDVEHTHNALQKFNEGLGKCDAELHMLLGNHEDRIDRMVEDNPELEGAMTIDDLRYPEYGWNTYTYRQPVVIDGVYYSHNFPSGLMGAAISGENIARSLINKNKVSCTVGHSHLLDYSISSKPSGKKIMGLSAGCYLTHKESYAYNTQRLWWSGLIVKRNVSGGEYDIETVTIKEVKKRYGRPSK